MPLAKTQWRTFEITVELTQTLENRAFDTFKITVFTFEITVITFEITVLTFEITVTHFQNHSVALAKSQCEFDVIWGCGSRDRMFRSRELAESCQIQCSVGQALAKPLPGP